MDQIPTFSELLRLAPVTALVLFIVGVGFYVGMKSKDEAISILKEWLNEMRRK